MIKYILHYAPAKIIPGLINFLGLTLYARIFTQEEYGRYAYVFATLSLIQSILFPWIRMGTLRFYQKYNEKGIGKEYENFTLFVFIIVSFILILIWVPFISFAGIDSQLKTLYFLGLVVILSQALFEQLMALARAKLQSQVFLINMIIKAIVKLSSVLLLVFLFNVNEQALFWGIIFAHIIPVFIYLVKFFNFKEKYLKVKKDFIKEIFHYGFPLTFTFLLAFVINSSDRILIKLFINEKAVGLYSIPYDFSKFTLTNAFMVFSMAFLPIIIRELEQKGYKEAQIRVKQYSSVLLTFVIPCAIFIVILAPQIANLFLGQNYNTNEAIFIIQLTTVASFFAGIKAYFFDYSFQLGKNTYMQIVPAVVAAILNVIFNIILLPIFGVVGAVYSTLISYLVGIVISILIGRNLFRMTFPVKDTFKIIICNIILILGIISIPKIQSDWIYLIITSTIGVLLYIILLFIFNIINIRHLSIKKFPYK